MQCKRKLNEVKITKKLKRVTIKTEKPLGVITKVQHMFITTEKVCV